MLNAIQIFDAILDFFKSLGEFVIVNMTDGGNQPSDLLLALAVGGFIIYVIVAWIRSNKSYESRLSKALDAMNAYFYKNPIINSDNLKEFNNRMKSVPKAMRTQWQTYMLYRDKEPSAYLTIEHCVERPMKYTSYKNTLRNTSLVFNVYMIILMAIVCGGILFYATDNNLGAALFNCLMVPAIVYIIKFIMNVIMEIRYSAIVGDIYANFGIFQRGLDKAVQGLPDYIDFEMLFTKREISDNIPILQDYIERRERKEKEELEKAKNSEVEHENFNFEAVGLNASLLLERALRECETYINNKKRLLYIIAQKNQELQDYKTNYENLNKEQLKQQQVSRENLERLRKNAETSTNRVEASRIVKQQEEELKRQEQLEKDAQVAYDKYLKQKDVIDEEVKKLEAELAEKKAYIEDVIMAEFKTYSAKLYDEVNAENETKYNAIIDEIKEDNEILSDEIKAKILLLEENGIENKPTLKYEAKLEKEKARELERQAEEEKEHEARINKAMETKRLADGEESSDEASGVAENAIDEEKLRKDLKSEITEEINQNKIKDDLKRQLKDEIKQELQNEKAENGDTIYDAYGGYYDGKGNYIYKDGSFYDREGNYYGTDGKLLIPAQQTNNTGYAEGHYDADGNYVYSDGSYYDAQGNFYDAQGNMVSNQDSDAGYYDDAGNYVYSDGSYYDAQGNFFDAQGNFVPNANGQNADDENANNQDTDNDSN